MKRIIALSSILLSVFVLLVYSTVPHHHHRGGRPCFVLELCEEDHVYNDEHTHHHQNIPNENNETCVLESEFLLSCLNEDIKPKVLYGKGHGHEHICLFPLCSFVVGNLNHNVEDFLFKRLYGEYIMLYGSAEIIPFHSLRAPPAVLS